MKQLLALLLTVLLAASSQAAPLFYRTITIDHTKVPNTNQSNFPLLISGTYSYLATVANGGKVQNTATQTGGGASITVGADITYTSDSACTTKLNWEFETYNATTGAVNIWVKVASVSTTVDTVIYECYDDTSGTTWQGNVNGTWDTNFKTVNHLPNGTTLDAKDSTSNANNGTINSVTAMAGQVDGGGSFDGGSGHDIDLGASASLNISGAPSMTVEMWAKRNASTSIGGLFTNRNDGTGVGVGIGIGVNAASVNQLDLIKFGVVELTIAGVPADTSWHHFAVTMSGTGVVFYVDGASAGTNGDTGNINDNSAANALVGTDGTSDYFTGGIDELRVSNTVRLADWIATEFNNQNSPSTFYTVGAETGVGGSKPPGQFPRVAQIWQKTTK
jgi:hypothetical protein